MDEKDIAELQRKAREILEKRNFERFKARLQVSYRFITDSEQAEVENETQYSLTTSEKGRTRETRELFKVFSEDVSSGGLRINSSETILPGSHLLVELYLPDLPLPVSVITQVMWCRPAQVTGFDLGLKFERVNKAELSKLERFLLLQRKTV